MKNGSAGRLHPANGGRPLGWWFRYPPELGRLPDGAPAYWTPIVYWTPEDLPLVMG